MADCSIPERLRSPKRAKARGVKLGRKPKLTEHQKRAAIRRRDHSDETVREIARSPDM
jgi:hypothetical protein